MSCAPPLWRGQWGFTLMEVLVALLLMAMLSLMSWRALDSVITTSERLDANAEDLNATVRVLGQLQTDLSLHASRDVLPGAAGSANDVLPPGIRVATRDRAAPVLTLIRAASDGRWQQVFWFVEDDTLRRSVGLPSASLPLPTPDPDGDVVLSDVTRFAVRAWLPKRGWTALPTDATGIQATGVEIAIQRRDQSTPYRQVVLLP